jgi:hypothetical protein
MLCVLVPSWYLRPVNQRTVFFNFAGDWGEVCPKTAADNNAGIHSGHTLVSIYGRGGAPYQVFTFGNPSTTKLAMAWDWSRSRASGPEQASDGC